MNTINSKICIIGNFAVGKTSTVERFVNNQFSDKYLTTIGVKVDTRELDLEDGVKLKLVIWDIAGTDRFGDVEFAYLRGASGYILVADGTRAQTLDDALALKQQVEERIGELPYVLLINKADLKNSWDISEAQISSLRESVQDVYITSARTGDNVNDAITRLGEAIAAQVLSDPQ